MPTQGQLDKAILLVAEQKAIPIDQLARFLALDVDQASCLVAKLKLERWIKSEEIAGTEWVWPLRAGLKRIGVEYPHCYFSRLNLFYLRAVNDVRLQLMGSEPQGRWISGRSFLPPLALPKSFPCALFETDGHTRAIKIEFRTMALKRYRAFIKRFLGNYDSVEYFCTAATRSLLGDLQGEFGTDRLVVRSLPKAVEAANGERSPDSFEAKVLELLADQTAIPIDQLARFLTLDVDQVSSLVAKLKLERWIKSETAGTEWVVPLPAGLKRMGVDYPHCQFSRLNLSYLRVANDVRLHLMGLEPQGRWITARSLGFKRGHLDALFEVDGHTRAIKIGLQQRWASSLRHSVKQLTCTYDSVEYFCTAATRSFLEDLQEEFGADRLVVRSLPKEVEVASAEGDPDPLEAKALELLAEQTAISVDQLPRFLGVKTARAERLAEALKKQGWTLSKKIGGTEWIWLTSPGLIQSGTGYHFRTLTDMDLRRIRLVNEARLQLTASEPQGRWISGRSDEQMFRGRLAGLFEAEGKTRAVLVEVEPRSFSRLRGAIAHLSSTYDSIEYFCSNATKPILEDFKERRRESPRLVIHSFPKEVEVASAEGDPDPLEAKALELLAEQTAISLDQLSRFLNVPYPTVTSLVAKLGLRQWLRCRAFSGRETVWVYLSRAGSKCSGTGYVYRSPGDMDLRRIRAVNEARLQLMRSAPQGRWISSRSPVLAQRRVGGLFEVDGQICAVMVAVEGPTGFLRLAGTVARLCSEYDAVEYFCSPQARAVLQRLKEESENDRLTVHLLPPVGVECEDFTEREREILHLLEQQSAIPLDQLARFLGVEKRPLTWCVRRMKEREWVGVAELLVGKPAWVWLRPAGRELIGGRSPHRPPPLYTLSHSHAVNEVRLALNERLPRGRWLSEHEVWCRRNAGGPQSLRSRAGHLPDAVFEIDGERHAIEVELSPKSHKKWRTVVAQHSINYDAVVYFCSPAVKARLERLKAKLNNPRLIVRSLPAKQLTLVPLSGHGDEKHGSPKRWELPILALIEEHGALRVDQLSRLLKYDAKKGKRLVNSLAARDLVFVRTLVSKEPAWVWCRTRGARLSGKPLAKQGYTPRLGSLDYLRALNEARIQVEAGIPRARWVTRRVLVAERNGKREGLPQALVEVDGERHAVQVILTPPPRSRLKKLMVRRCADYDALVLFCAPGAYTRVESTAKMGRRHDVVVRKLPGYRWRSSKAGHPRHTQREHP